MTCTWNGGSIPGGKIAGKAAYEQSCRPQDWMA